MSTLNFESIDQGIELQYVISFGGVFRISGEENPDLPRRFLLLLLFRGGGGGITATSSELELRSGTGRAGIRICGK